MAEKEPKDAQEEIPGDIAPKLVKRLRRLVEQKLESADGEILRLRELLLMVQADPTGRARYLRWMVDLYQKSTHSVFIEDLYKLKEDLTLFEKIKHDLPLDQRNILNYSTHQEMFEVIYPFRERKEAQLSKRQLRGDTAVEGEYDIILDNGKYLAVIPKSHRASCYWGSGSRWCTAHSGYSGHYHNYADYGPLLILRYYDEHGVKKNVQINIETQQFMDNEDRSIDPEAFFNKYPDVLDAFIGYISEKRYVPVKPRGLDYYQKNFLDSLEKGKTSLARIYLANGANVDGVDMYTIGAIPLAQAINIKDEAEAIKMIKILLRHNAKVNVDDIIFPMANIVAMRGNLTILEILLEHGLNLNVADMFGRTPLHAALMSAKVDMAKRLIELGLDPDTKDMSGNSARDLARGMKSR